MRPIHTQAYNNLLDLFEGNQHTALLDTLDYSVEAGKLESFQISDRVRMWSIVRTVLNIPVQVAPIVVQSQIVDLISDSSIGISDDYVIHRRLLPVPAGYMHFEKPLKMPFTQIQRDKRKNISFFPKQDIVGIHDTTSPITFCNITGVLFSPVDVASFDDGENVVMGTKANIDGDILVIVLFSDQGRCEDGCGVTNTPVQTIAWDFGDNFVDSFPKNQELISDIVERHEVTKENAAAHLEATGHLLKKLVALFEFMGQRIVASQAVKPKIKLKKKRDRRLVRGFNGEVPDLTIVRLRRLQSQNRTGENGDPLERNIHWAVSGHWRNQPSNDGINLIWISPYTKGNKSLPLRHGSRLFDVGR